MDTPSFELVLADGIAIGAAAWLFFSTVDIICAWRKIVSRRAWGQPHRLFISMFVAIAAHVTECLIIAAICAGFTDWRLIVLVCAAGIVAGFFSKRPSLEQITATGATRTGKSHFKRLGI